MLHCNRPPCGVWISVCYAVLCCNSLLSGWQMVPRQADQQEATQCSLDSTEMCANAFRKWPLLLYLITQSGVNLNVIVVCHGEAHLARVWELTAAGCLSFAAHLESCSTGLVVRHCQLSWHWLENFPPFAFSFCLHQMTLFLFWGFFDSVAHDPVKSSAIIGVT